MRSLFVLLCVGSVASAQQPCVASSPLATSRDSSLTVGDTAQASVRATLRANSVLHCDVQWSSTDTTKATVDASGLIRAVGAGKANIRATVGSVNDVIPITIAPGTTPVPPPPPPPSPDPVPPSSGSEPRPDRTRLVFEDHFSVLSGYAKRGSVALTPSDSGTAARFSYSSASTDNLIEKDLGAAYTNVFVTYRFRLSQTADPSCGGRNGSGMKWFMWWRTAGGRYTNGVGLLATNSTSASDVQFTTHDNGSVAQPNPFPQNLTSTPRYGMLRDGQWHRYTLHTVTGTNGYEEIWIDGVKILDSSGKGYDHQPGGVSMFQLPGVVVGWTGCSDFTIDVDDLVVWRG